MNVPITSDLDGYVAFWHWWVRLIVFGFSVFGLTVISLLWLIYRKL